MAVIITEQDKVKCRHHLGYLDVEAAQTFVLGIPAAVQTQFMIEGALNRLLPQAYNLFQTLICRMDSIEEQVFCKSNLADVDVLGEITVNRNRLKELAQYYKIAQQAMANLLGIVPNPFDQREWLMGGMLNVSVSG